MDPPSTSKPKPKPNDDAEEMISRREMAPGYAANTASTRLLPPASSSAPGAIVEKSHGAVPVKSSRGVQSKKEKGKPVLELAPAMAENEQPQSHQTSGRDQTNSKHALQLAPGIAPGTTASNTVEKKDTPFVAPGALGMNDISSGEGNSLSETNMNFPAENPTPSAESVTSNNPLHVEAILVDEGEDRQRIRDEVRQEILGEAVVGEITAIVDGSDENKNDGTDNTRNSHRKMILGISVIMIIVVVGAVIGVVLGTSEIPSSTPSTRPSLSPSSAPTEAFLETTNPPTVTPPPNQTSEVPISTPTSQSSLSPSSSPTGGKVDNSSPRLPDPLILGQSSNSTMANGMYQMFNLECDTAREEKSYFGLWYVYHPTVSHPVTVEVCGVISSVYAYEDEDIAGFLDKNATVGCILGEIITEGDTDGCSRVSWNADLKLTYYFLVGYPEDVVNATVLPVEDTTVLDFTIQIVDNDRCDYAFGPILPTSGFGVTLSYTTAQATVEGFVVPACGDSAATATPTPGVWYQVSGTGRFIAASTCNNQTVLDAQISVFRGSCGVELECVGVNINFCETSSSVSWPSVVDETYYVLVHGEGGDESSNPGVFDLAAFELVLTDDDGTGDLLPNWFFCSSSSQCQNGCCSDRYSDDGKLKCTILEGGYDASICLSI